MSKTAGKKYFEPDWLTRLFSKLRPFHLKDLAPEENADLGSEEKTYYRCLRTALKNPRINNIALTGHYGCGKSTILRTFEKHFGRGHEFLCISLATFGKASQNPAADGEPADTDTTQQQRLSHLVEHSILQQMFYQVPKRNIPRSRFKRISRPRLPFLPLAILLAWLFCLGCAVAVLRPATFKNVLVLHSFLQQLAQTGNTWLSIAAVGTLLIPAFGVSRFFSTITLRKLNLKACEIEIAEDKAPSVLNKHLDEILYFFEATRYDVVVFEDLDRFETPEIFTKLREINTLINRNIQALKDLWPPFSSRKRVVFIYGIKDEMFTGEERTKFFDLIIPVVPIVNHANSRDLLRRELGNRHPVRVFNIPEVLLGDIARYVPDMRLLYNIVNEFAVYRERLNMEGLRDASLLAIMVYKNILPKDFADLQDRRGLLYDYFKQKQVYRNQTIAMIEAQVSTKCELLRSAEAGTERSLEELRILWVHRLQQISVEDNPGWIAYSVLIRGGWHVFDAALDDDGLDKLLSAERSQVCIMSINGQRSTVNVNFANARNEQQVFADRKKAVLARDKAAQEAIQKEIGVLRERIAEIKNARLAQVLESGDVAPLNAASYLPNDDDIARERKGRLLHLLLRQGYIDETYESYLSYFYEGTLSNQDRVFVMSVKNANPLDPDYELNNVAEIVGGQFTPHEAQVQATRNIYVLDHMLDTHSWCAVVDRLRGEPREATDLLTLHLRTSGLRHDELIRRVYQAWPELWDMVHESGALSPSERDLHLSGIIMYAQEDLLQGICSASSLQRHVSDRDDFIDYGRSLNSEDRVVVFLRAVHPEFTALSTFPQESAISRLIYEESMYAVNAAMIALMYRTFVGECPDDLPPTISSIRAAGSVLLRECVERHLDGYLAVLLALTGALTRESEDTVIWLLNNGEVSHDLRLQLASGLCVPVTRLEDIENDDAIWSKLLEAAAVVPSWRNVWAYLRTVAEDELNETLIAFLSSDSVARELSCQRMENGHLSQQENSPNLAALLLSSPSLEKKTVDQLVQAIPPDYSVQDLDDLHSDFVPVIISRKQVEFTVENYEYVREKCRDSLGEFIKNNRHAFLAHVSEVQVDGEDLSAMLAALERRKQKKEIAEAVLGKGIPAGIEAVADDLCDLVLHDETFAETLDIEAISTIVVAAQDRALKIEILTLSVDLLRDDNISTILMSIGGDYGRLAKHGAWRRLKKSPINEKLAVALTKRGYVSSFKVKNDVIRINTYVGERPTESEEGAA